MLLLRLTCLLAIGGAAWALDGPLPPVDEVPDPIGLGPRLALLDFLREELGESPAADATYAELKAQYNAIRAARMPDALAASEPEATASTVTIAAPEEPENQPAEPAELVSRAPDAMPEAPAVAEPDSAAAVAPDAIAEPEQDTVAAAPAVITEPVGEEVPAEPVIETEAAAVAETPQAEPAALVIAENEPEVDAPAETPVLPPQPQPTIVTQGNQVAIAEAGIRLRLPPEFTALTAAETGARFGASAQAAFADPAGEAVLAIRCIPTSELAASTATAGTQLEHLLPEVVPGHDSLTSGQLLIAGEHFAHFSFVSEAGSQILRNELLAAVHGDRLLLLNASATAGSYGDHSAALWDAIRSIEFLE